MAQKKSTSLAMAKPLDTMEFTQMIRWASEAAGLSKWEQFRLQSLTKRQRAQLFAKLSELEHETLMAEALAMAEGRHDAAREQAGVVVLDTQMDCLTQAGRLLDRSLTALRGCSEESQDILGPAMQRVTASYARGVEYRAATRG